MPDTLDKSALRQDLLTRRQALSKDEIKTASRLICSHFLEAGLHKNKTVIAGYSPIRGEADITAALHDLRAQGYVTALPRINGERVDFIRVEDDTALTPGGFGIPEPKGGENMSPEILLIPLLGFDSEGHRLGYGKGFYDRYLARPEALNALRVGIAYDWQEIPRLPAEAHDVRLHAVITNQHIMRFEK